MITEACKAQWPVRPMLALGPFRESVQAMVIVRYHGERRPEFRSVTEDCVYERCVPDLDT